MLALIGFILVIVLMVVLIKEIMSPVTAFIILPLVAAVFSGFGIPEIAGFVKTGANTMLNTAMLFIFSISYFSLMSNAGLFDPLINFLVQKIGKSITTIFIAILLTTFVAHLDGSGATTFLIVVPAFLPVTKKMGIRPEALLGSMCGAYGVMNLLPWGGPTMRASAVIKMDVSDLYRDMALGTVILIIVAFAIMFVISFIEKKNGAKIPDRNLEQIANEKEAENSIPRWKYLFNLFLTLAALILLFVDTGLPLHLIFMMAFVIGLIVNFPQAKEQNNQIKSYAAQAMVMTMTLFSVGIFMGVINDSGMVKAMATAIVNVLPSSFAPHMHWFMALFAVPMIMILGTDAYYYALLPIILGVVSEFGVQPQTVAITFLLTATFGTPISPSVAAVYVGLGLADTTIGKHIKYNLRIMWPASILVLLLATITGVIRF
jgi:CitMHS family citrate-Mg2+:H+ or citrate-Ca2+:H+ symporter